MDSFPVEDAINQFKLDKFKSTMLNFDSKDVSFKLSRYHKRSYIFLAFTYFNKNSKLKTKFNSRLLIINLNTFEISFL